MPPYATRSHQGFWRFLVVREGKRTGQTLVHIITAAHRHQDRLMEELASHLLKRFPAITSLVHSVSHKKAQVAIADETRTVMGPGSIEERVGALRFKVSAHSFFQTNSLGAERLYDTILQLASLEGGETIWDMYCGTGSIALYCARQARRVVGFEVIPEAVADARGNAILNGIENCSFHLGDINDLSRDPAAMIQDGGVPDVVISDPPRAGMHLLLVSTAIFLLAFIIGIGMVYWRLHALPEQLAHRGEKIQYQFVAVLGLLALFTHNHAFWVAGLRLAFVRLPDFSTPLATMARSLSKMAGLPDPVEAQQAQEHAAAHAHSPAAKPEPPPGPQGPREAHGG